MAVNEKNMTSGSPGKLIITFAIPLMLGNVFQQFYTMADTMIVGQVVGVEALAAVGAADWLVWLVFGIITLLFAIFLPYGVVSLFEHNGPVARGVKKLLAKKEAAHHDD